MAYQDSTSIDLYLKNLEMIATLGFVAGNEAGKDALEFLSTSKIIYEIYQRVNEEDNKLAELRAQAILRIAEQVKKSPGISDEQRAKMIQKEIEKFAKEAKLIISP